ncbi:hypothetical protein RDI58_005033 [Solanum bulbocastanum]|uniref:F-box domain-containing protein n=1 Tax=Solanum bulbocastanum TaxID=147425 RepID=A0AAN8U707_SOLBU
MDIHLPEEIVMDILSRLPVQSLLRFKCISKPWKKLISKPYFTRKHLNHAKNDQNFQKFLSCQPYPKDGVLSYYCASLSSTHLVESVQKLDCPSVFKPRHVKIYCCFDGLSIMGVSNYNKRDVVFFLWNPFTRESILLPNPEFPPKKNFICGMGYDSTKNDYKVLKIGLDRNYDRNVSIELLSLKKGFWSKIDEYSSGIFYKFNGSSCLAFVHGAFHWVGYSEKCL